MCTISCRTLKIIISSMSNKLSHNKKHNRSRGNSILAVFGLGKKKTTENTDTRSKKISKSNNNLNKDTTKKGTFLNIPAVDYPHKTNTTGKKEYLTVSATHSYSDVTSLCDKSEPTKGVYNVPLSVGPVDRNYFEENSLLSKSRVSVGGSVLSITNHSYISHSKFSISEPNLPLQTTKSINAQKIFNKIFATVDKEIDEERTNKNLYEKKTIHDTAIDNAKELLKTFDTLISRNEESVIEKPKPIKDNNIKFLLNEDPEEVQENTSITELNDKEAIQPNIEIKKISSESDPVIGSHTRERSKTLSSKKDVSVKPIKRCPSTSLIQKKTFPPLNVRSIPSNALKLSVNTAVKVGTGLGTGSLRPRGSSFFNSNSPVPSNSSKQLGPQLDEDAVPLILKDIPYASEKKNNEFHKLFKHAPLTEKLISEQNAAIMKDIMLQGKLYICDHNLYFYSNILGYMTSYVISYRDITGIQKKNVAVIFPNAISVNTDQNKYVFASLSSREATFDTIKSVWDQFTDHYKTVSTKIDTSSDFDSESNSGSSSSYEESFETEINSAESANVLDKGRPRHSTSISTDITVPSVKGSKTESGGIYSIPVLGLKKHQPTVASFIPTTTDQVIMDSTIDAPLGQVVNILFGKDTSHLEDFLKSQNNFDFSNIPSDLLETKSREYSYTKPLLGSIGPSKTQCLITENLDNYDLDDYVQVTQTTKCPDVPSGDAFTTRTTFILSWDKNNSTKLTVYIGIDWEGKSWIKGPIEKNTIDGVTSSTKVLLDRINKLLSKKETKLGRSRKGSSENQEGITGLPNHAPFTHPPTTVDIQTEKDDKIIRENITLDCSVGTSFELLFGSDSSYLRDILSKQNNIDISSIPKFENKTREYSYTKLLNNSLGPKQTQCLITETIEHMDMESYIMVKQVSKTPDVPSGSNFTVQTRFYLWWGQGNTTIMTVITNVVWTGKSFIKGAIEKGSIDGQKATTDIMIQEMKKRIDNARSSSKGGKKKRSKRKKSPKPAEEISVSPVTPSSSSLIETIHRFILNAFSPLSDPLIKDFNLTSPKTIGSLIITCILILSFMRSLLTNKEKSTAISVLRPGKILIDNVQYNYVPAYETLMDPYEEAKRYKHVRNTKKSSGNIYNDLIDETEKSIWSWIKDRGDSGIIHRDHPYYDEPNIKNRNLEELRETIKVANIQLGEMQKRLNELQEEKDGFI